MKFLAAVTLSMLLFSSVIANADDVVDRPPKVDARLGFSLPYWGILVFSMGDAEPILPQNVPFANPGAAPRFALHLRQLFVLDIEGYFRWDISDNERLSELIAASYLRAGAMLSSARKNMPRRGWTRDGALTGGYGLVYTQLNSHITVYDPWNDREYRDYARMTMVQHCLSFALSLSTTYWIRHAGIFFELFAVYDVGFARSEPEYTVDLPPDGTWELNKSETPGTLQMFRFGLSAGVAFR